MKNILLLLNCPFCLKSIASLLVTYFFSNIFINLSQSTQLLYLEEPTTIFSKSVLINETYLIKKISILYNFFKTVHA